MQVNNTLK